MKLNIIPEGVILNWRKDWPQNFTSGWRCQDFLQNKRER